MWLRRKKSPEIIVMSRSEALAYCREKHRTESVIISISDPNMEYEEDPFVSPANRVTAILPLCFCDAEGPGKDVYGIDVDESDLMTDGDAENVAAFVRANRGRLVIVHCDAGVSRSAGVAAAIAKYLTGDDALFFRSDRYSPNLWCYTKTLSAFLDI